MKSLFLFAIALTFASFARAEVEPGEICKTENIMTLPWTICLADKAKPESELDTAIVDAMKEIHRVDEWMSEWKPNSLVTQINNNAGIKPVPVTQEVIDTIRLSNEQADLTGGAFDITFNAFFGLYSWKPGHERFPTPEEIKRLLPLVNYKLIQIDEKNKTVYLPKKGMKIGLGGMGEGWTIDKVFELLQPRHIKSGYIDASGGVRVWGVKPSGKLWLIGVGDPRPMNPDESRKKSLYKIYATDLAVTTAGDTEKYFIRDGKRYHHIIDPKTGESADRSIQVTAICKTATLCDLADDGIYILGPIEGRKYAEKLGIEAVMIDPKKNVTFTKGLFIKNSAWGPGLTIDNPNINPSKNSTINSAPN